jgi:hypothetical protein
MIHYTNELSKALQNKVNLFSKSIPNTKFTDPIGRVDWNLAAVPDYPAIQLSYGNHSGKYFIRINYIWGGTKTETKGFTSNVIIPELIDLLNFSNIQEIIIPDITDERATCSYLRGIFKTIKKENLQLELVGKVILLNYENNTNSNFDNSLKSYMFDINKITKITGPQVDQCGLEGEGERKGFNNNGPVILYNNKYLQITECKQIKIKKNEQLNNGGKKRRKTIRKKRKKRRRTKKCH